MADASSGNSNSSVDQPEVVEWMQRIQGWSAKIFTLAHIPEKHRLFVSKFVRRVVIARMAESPDLASVYHLKLKDAYKTEDKLKDADVLKESEEQLDRLLDAVERQLHETQYLAGEDFTMADSMFIPVLARIALLNLEDAYINCRPKTSEYWKVVQLRPSCRAVIGKYFSGWRKYKTLLKTWCFVCIRSMFRRY